jgi:hypothetical protein
MKMLLRAAAVYLAFGTTQALAEVEITAPKEFQDWSVFVERVASEAETRWQGLLKPKEPKVEDRISLEEFVSAAVQQGLVEHPEMSVPS